jgi:LDH2 family malate/lactate/ureidoglycolate dehydrogenase
LPTCNAENVWKTSVDILVKIGVPVDEAKLVCSLLRDASLMGIDSHGFFQLPRYVRLVREGVCRPRANITVLKRCASTALIDGGGAFGQVVGMKAMKMAIRKADQTGIGCVGILRSGHLGALIHYSMMALQHEMIGLAMSTGGLGVAPFGGYKRMMGINPISIAIPAGTQEPIVMDFATSQLALGKIEMFLRKGRRLPERFIVDSKGHPTTDPAAYYKGGAILPFGGYKGYGLCLAVDLLAGALTSQPFGLSTKPGQYGALMIAINVSGYTSIESFKRRVDTHIRNIKSSPAAGGVNEILVPGEPEFRERERRLKEGIPIDDKTYQELLSLSQELKIHSRLK